MYFDGTTCQRCDSSCSSCINSPTTCSSCPDHLILKGGVCQATSCDCAMGLGVCMTSLITPGSRKWIAFIVLPLVLAVAGIFFSLYIRKQRRNRRLEAKQFGDAIDQVNVIKGDGDGGETDTVKLRLEKVLGLNRIRIESEDQVKRSRLRELLLPRSRKQEGDIPLVHKKSEAGLRTSQFMAPPPPYSNPNDMGVRSEKELIRQSRIIDMSESPAASSSIFASSSTPEPILASGSGPRPPHDKETHMLEQKVLRRNKQSGFIPPRMKIGWMNYGQPCVLLKRGGPKDGYKSRRSTVYIQNVVQAWTVLSNNPKKTTKQYSHLSGPSIIQTWHYIFHPPPHFFRWEILHRLDCFLQVDNSVRNCCF
jgi:hypothetical protein